jgi:hypothetical protein
VAQRTRTLQTKLDTQRSFLVGFSHKQAELTAYIFNPTSTDLSAVLEVVWSFCEASIRRSIHALVLAGIQTCSSGVLSVPRNQFNPDSKAGKKGRITFGVE